MRKFILLILLLQFPLIVSANQLYKWVDDEGVTHFSHQPPPDDPALAPSELKAIPLTEGPANIDDPPAPDESDTSTPPGLTPEQPDPETAPGPAKADSKVEYPDKDPEKCRAAQENLKQFKEFERIRTKDPESGEFRYLDQEERKSETEKWRRNANVFC